MDEPSPETPWHSLAPEAIEERLETRSEGLSRREVDERRRRVGPNEMETDPPPNPIWVFVRQFKSPLIYILLVATVITVAIAHYIDAGVIAAVLLLNAVIGFTQERRAESAVRELSRMVSPKARVVRDGREQNVESRELVPGDRVFLESGDRVPADIRLTSTTTLSVDESLLTGESTSVDKYSDSVAEETPVADRTSMVYTGSVIARGRARGYVVATGANTELGEIAESLRSEEAGETPLQQRMDRFAKLVSIVAGGAAVAGFGLGVAMGEPVTDMFVLAIALAVSAVPEGLPVVLTITLAVGVSRMASRNAIIRRLPAVETLGSTTVIASDKTGTLTENRMTVEHLWADDADRLIGESVDSLPALEIDEELEGDDLLVRSLLAGVLTSEAHLNKSDEGAEATGDPTEIALLVAADRLGLDPERARERFPTVAQIPFEPEQQYSASWHPEGEGHVLYAKGAPERILEMCDRQRRDGEDVALDREAVAEKADAMAARGLRVLAFAYDHSEPPNSSERVDEPEGLCFVGLVGMMDPPRPEVREAIAGCKAAGIRVMMVTGDHVATAGAIGRDLEITDETTPVLAGTDLAALSDEQLRDRVTDVSVFARVAPDQKLRIVRALQANDHSVAVTGDGVNDAPALNAAEIGIAMGKSGTDVARAASDMVLTDDNFASIHAAVEQGRITFDNIRKVTFFLISSGAAEILAILSSLAFAWPIPFLPAQILWLNLVTNGLQDVALAFEPREGDVLERPPRRRDEGVVSGLLWERTLLAGIVMAVGTLALFAWEYRHSGSPDRARTVALTTMVLFQMFHVGNARGTIDSIFQRSPFSNRFLFLATLGAFLVHVGALYVPATQYILRVEPIGDLETWIRMAAVASTILVAIEAHKLVHRLVAPGSREGRAAREAPVLARFWS